MENKILGSVMFDFSCGSDSCIAIKTDYINNGDSMPGYFPVQTVTMQSDSNKLILELEFGHISPNNLRKLADALERCESQIISSHPTLNNLLW